MSATAAVDRRATRRPSTPVLDVLPEARDLLAAIGRFYGCDGWFRHEREPRLCFAACPACKSKPLRHEHVSQGYPLVIEDLDPGYRLLRLCLCPEKAIVAALGPVIFWAPRGHWAAHHHGAGTRRAA